MTTHFPQHESDLVLIDVKAQPSGWPPASLDPESGRAPQATSGKPAQPKHKISSLYGFRGLPTL
jgi:hypothetical protein